MEREEFRKRLVELAAEARANPRYEANKAMFDAMFDSHNPYSRLPLNHPALSPKGARQ